MVTVYRSFTIGLLLLALSLRGFAAEPAKRPITDADAVLAIYTEDWGLGSSSGPQLILSIWGDGYIVWSEDRLKGGAPYHAGRIEAKKIDQLLSRLERDGIFDEKSLADPHFGPDSTFTVIQIRRGKKQIEMRSWHELAESHEGTFAPAEIRSLEGQQLFAALKKQSSENLLYRLVWNEIRARTAELVPSNGSAVDGKIEAKHGTFSWLEKQSDGKPASQ